MTDAEMPRLPHYSHWRDLWQALGYQGSEAWLMQALSRLLAAYRETHRHYHTCLHLEECLNAFETVRDLLHDPACVGLALYGHDVIHDPARRDNETRSADWLGELLQAGGIDADKIARIRALILATRHDQATLPADPDQATLVDIDLAILGSPAARFACYEAQIRAEYAHIDDAAYRAGRGQVLAGFLARTRIYQTPHFFGLLEAEARQNLSAQMARLAQAAS